MLTSHGHGAKKTRRGLMQRLSSWFGDHLPLRRRAETRRADTSRSSAHTMSKSAAPRLRYSISAAAASSNHSKRQISHEEPATLRERDWNDLMTGSVFTTKPSSLFPTGGPDFLSQSFTAAGSCRQKIRTNPWVRSNERSSIRNKAFFNPTVATTTDTVDCNQPNFELLYASMDRGSSLRVKSLDESTCSSGYGSQDSTPESSVHSPDWQPSSQLERRGILVDKAVECRSVDLDETERYLNVFKPPSQRYEPAYGTYDPLDDFSRIDDDHVYHELESLNRISMLFNDNVSYVDDNDITSPTASFKHCPGDKSPSRSSSPIYAVPYEGTSGSSSSSASGNSPRNDDAASVCGGYRRVKRIQREKLGPAPFPVNDDTYGPLEIASPFYASSLCRSRGPAGHRNTDVSTYGKGPSSAYEHYSSMPPFLHIPPPPPKETDTFFQDNYYYPQPPKASEVDFLAELDQQIAELQLQSDAVRQMVEQAKERRELRVRTRQLCMEHLRELRKMRWFMHNNFELRL